MHRLEKGHLIELEKWIEASKLSNDSNLKFIGLAEILETHNNGNVMSYGAVIIDSTRALAPYTIWVIAHGGALVFPLTNLRSPRVPATMIHETAAAALEALTEFRRHIMTIKEYSHRVKNPRASDFMDAGREDEK